jgi:hypothetical protein
MAPMNPDLKRRLKTVARFNGLERRFLLHFQFTLCKEIGCWAEEAVTVRFEMIQGDEDDTAYVQKYDDGSYEVVIDQRLSFGEMCDYMIHEFAHVGTWCMDEPDDHGPLWGMEYAKLYRLYLAVYEWWFADVDANGRST